MMLTKTMMAGALVVLGLNGVTGVGVVSAMEVATPIATPYAQQEEADALYRQGRRELNSGEYRDAARTFRQLRTRFRESEHVADSYYWEAFALHRTGSGRDLERALELLGEQSEQFAEASTRSDAPALQVQIEGALAQRGNARAAQVIESRARPARGGRSESPARARPAGRRGAEVGSCDTGEQELRAMALNALLNMNADRARPILKEVLEARDECSVELRRQAVFLVAQKMDDDAVEILLDLAHRRPDPDPEVREQAVFWLSQVGGPEASAALIDILRSSTDRAVQENAIFALSQHGGNEAWAVLREFAERADAPVDLRENAIFWLGQADGGGEYLRGLYDRIDEASLRENIVFGISQSGSPEDAEWLLARALDNQEDIDVRKNALFWAGQMGMEISQLADLYHSVDDREMKEQVIFVLSQSSDRREAVTQLISIAEGEEDAELKQNAIFWLGQSDDPRATEFLLRILRGGGRIR
jgi:HEAT repeat protein